MPDDLAQFIPPSPCQVEDIQRCLLEARRLFVIHCESTLTLASAALDAARSINDAQLQIEALLLQGQSQQVIQHTDAALSSFTLALRLSKKNGLLQLQSDCLAGVAVCHQNLRQTHKSLQAWLSALELALAAPQIERYVNAYLGIANLYVEHGNFEQAFYYQSQAVEWAQQSEQADLQSKAQLHLASTLIQLQQYDLAELLLLKTEGALILPVRLSWLAEINHYLGQINLARQDWARAQTYFEAAYELNISTQSRWGQTQSLLSLGKLSAQQGQHEQAITHLSRALELAQQQKSDHLQQQIHLELSACYEAAEDFVRATMHHIGYHDYYLQLHKQNAKDQLDAISARRLKQAEVKLQLLHSELAMKQLMQERSLEHERMQQLENAAFHDALTGALNRHALDEQWPLLAQQIEQEQGSLSLLIIDFDHFKQVNDRHSHQVGDEVLKTGVGILQGLTRDSDLLVRYGGEEFVLILPRNDATIAVRIANRMRQEIERFDWASLSPNLAVTISLGCAQWQSAMSLETLIAAADQALYQAKHQGRNRVCLYTEAPQ